MHDYILYIQTVKNERTKKRKGRMYRRMSCAVAVAVAIGEA